MAGRIVAMGGGGFLMEPENPRLDDYVLGLARTLRPRVCFLPTASGDAEGHRLAFYRAFAARDCIPVDLPLFVRDPGDLRAFLLAQDVIYVGGGSTANLLAVWRVHGLDDLLGEALAAGAVLCGVSAGMNCWFEASVTDSFGAMAALHDGLGMLPGSSCPHFDGEEGRRPAYHGLIADGFPAGYAADDGAALHFADGELVEAVASRPAARAYRVQLGATGVVQEELPTRFLG